MISPDCLTNYPFHLQMQFTALLCNGVLLLWINKQFILISYNQLVSLQMQEGKLTKNNSPKTQYPYLSIDQLKKNQHNYTDLKGEVSQFFNIKFDQKYQHRQMQSQQSKQNPSKNNNPDLMSLNAKTEILPKIVETSSESRKMAYQLNLRKRLDTQKLLQNLQKLITRQKSFDLKYHLASPEKKKQGKKTECSSEKKTHNDIENVLCIENIEHKTAAEKSKTMPFPQMLKKCSKLKEIIRYQQELVNEKVLTSQGIAIRFYTESFSSIEQKDDSFYEGNKFKIRPSVKKTAQNKLANFFQNSNIEPLRDSDKTLDIRKYNNHSVMKQRCKFAAKRHLQKQQRCREQRVARRSEPVEFNKDDEMVAPWDQIDLKYDLQLH